MVQSNLGAFTIDDKVLPEGTTYIWSFASGYGMKASAYVNKTNYASESWLVSPKFDCTNATALTLSFSEAANFFTSAENVSAYTSVKVKEVGTDTWTDLTLSARASGTAWTFTDGITADLSAYVGKKMQIAFVYTSTAELAGTWEVKNFELKGKGEVTTESEVVVAVGGQVHDGLGPHVDSRHYLLHFNVIVLAVPGHAQIHVDLGAKHGADTVGVDAGVQLIGADRHLTFGYQLPNFFGCAVFLFCHGFHFRGDITPPGGFHLGCVISHNFLPFKRIY